ncbi:hypothetical protein [Parasitella parasitica]|uniref:Uncharacterized protein n=1 Tax=Parasitella parasitica TaxID=35722 RepID=A0A0B7NUS7_9FUNG|nr:hypothetical protein [Parasitella parasitica]
MMGVFQRNNSTNIEQQQKFLSKPVSLSFGSTITRHGSPLSSPLLSLSTSVHEEPTVVFDSGEQSFRRRKKTEQQPAPLNYEHMDSSFFNDDEDEWPIRL